MVNTLAIKTAMIPIVLGASLEPWPMQKAAVEKCCITLKILSTFLRELFLKILSKKHSRKKPKNRPISGDNTMKANVIMIGCMCSTPLPLTNHAAPMMPPIRACEVEMGIPLLVQTATQMAAPTRADNIR